MSELPKVFSGMDPALIRGLTQRRISRRTMLRYTSVGAGALALAACGVSTPTDGQSPGTSPSPGGVGSPEWWAQQKQTGNLNFANWPLYIDVDEEQGTYPSLEEFTKTTGIEVNYRDVIPDNDTFFPTIRPALEAGQDTGWDLIVITSNSSPFRTIMRRGWVIALDQSAMTNFQANASDLVKDPPWDPGNRFTMAWQSGFTGIGYNPKLTKRKVTGIQDLFDPAFAGKVGMMTDIQDFGSFGLLSLGIEPVDSTPDDWTKAAEALTKQRDDGIVRQYYDQKYIDALSNGDTWISMAWSGDVFLRKYYEGYPDLEFVFPEEGAMLFTDCMMIPMLAQHPRDAMIYMDHVYRPDVQAVITDYIGYVSPVPAAQEIILNEIDDPTVANSPLVFPTDEIAARAKAYYEFTTSDEENTWNETFQAVQQG